MAAGAYFPWYPFDQNVYDECIEEWPESASLTGLAGTPVIIDSNGRIDECGTSPSVIYGVLAADGKNGTAAQYKNLVIRLRAGDKWVICVDEALAQNLLGVAAGNLGVVKDATTGLWYGSTGDAGDQCRAVGYIQGTTPPGFQIGDTKWAAFVVFDDANLQTGQ